MTDRTYHIVAIALLVAGLAAGGVSWALDGTPFWIAVGIGAALVIAGLFVAGRVSGGDEDATRTTSSSRRGKGSSR